MSLKEKLVIVGDYMKNIRTRLRLKIRSNTRSNQRMNLSCLLIEFRSLTTLRHPIRNMKRASIAAIEVETVTTRTSYRLSCIKSRLFRILTFAARNIKVWHSAALQWSIRERWAKNSKTSRSAKVSLSCSHLQTKKKWKRMKKKSCRNFTSTI